MNAVVGHRTKKKRKGRPVAVAFVTGKPESHFDRKRWNHKLRQVALKKDRKIDRSINQRESSMKTSQVFGRDKSKDAVRISTQQVGLRSCPESLSSSHDVTMDLKIKI